MIKLLGFLLGVGVSTAVLLLIVVGPDTAQDHWRAWTSGQAETASEIVPGPQDDQPPIHVAEVFTPAPVQSERPSPAAPPPAAPPIEAVDESKPIPPQAGTSTQQLARDISADEPEPSELASAEPVRAGDPGDPEWHPIWRPFHSEISARGFAERLENVTGLDYRVERLKRGSYQVSVAHNGEQDRLARLTRIETATGLKLMAAQ